MAPKVIKKIVYLEFFKKYVVVKVKKDGNEMMGVADKFLYDTKDELTASLASKGYYVDSSGFVKELLG